MISWSRAWALGLSVAASWVLMPSASAQHDDPWRGCVVEDLVGSARRLRCPGMDVSLLRGPTMSQDEWLESMAARNAGGATITRERLDVDARPIVLRIVQGDRRRVIASPIPETVVVCDVEPAQLDRCRAAITAIVRRGLPPGVTFPEPPLELLGRTLRIPPGCQLVGAERIACTSGAALDWRSGHPHDPRETIARYASVLRGRFPEAIPEEVSCVIAGHDGIGARFVIGGQRTILCAVEDGRGAATAQCIGELRPGTAWPEPCGQVFEGTVPR